jgi:methyl-accepting chemotaxis protein
MTKMFTISKKIFSGFLTVLALLVLVIIMGYTQISSVNDSYETLIDNRVEKVVLAKDLVTSMKTRMVAGRGYLISGKSGELETYESAQEEFDKISGEILTLITLKKTKDLHSEINSLSLEYDNLMEKAFQFKQQEKTAEYSEIITNQTMPIVNQLSQRTDEFIKMQNDEMKKERLATNEKVANIQMWMIIIGLLSTVIGIGVAFYISKIISGPVVKMAAAASKIAAGDLSVENIEVKNKDEIHTLADSFNTMAENLRQLIQKVSTASEQVAASSEELTASAEQTSKATEQVTLSLQEVAVGADRQVRSMEESSNAIHEMSVGVQQIAANAQSVTDHMNETSKAANEGGVAVKEAAQQMNEINDTVFELNKVIKGLGERSAAIGQIVEVITGIASQTNLLALNAAIEAARAGENGKGFAVVADEVRKLAEQSANSARQISELIQMIQAETGKAVQSMTITTQKVEKGIDVVDHTGQSFKQIQSSVQMVAAQIEEVSSASQQMAAGTEQIVGSIEMISRIAEESAASTQLVSASSEEQLASMEEISASASSLSTMAEELQEMVSKFKI